MATREANALTRCAIILAASGVTAVAQVTVNGVGGVVLSAISLIAAFAGLAGVMLYKSRAVVLTNERVAAWLARAPDDVADRLLADKMAELERARRDLQTTNRWVMIGLAILAASWVGSFLYLLSKTKW